MLEDYLILIFYWTYIPICRFANICNTNNNRATQNSERIESNEKIYQLDIIKRRGAWTGIENCQRTLKILAQGRLSYGCMICTSCIK